VQTGGIPHGKGKEIFSPFFLFWEHGKKMRKKKEEKSKKCETEEEKNKGALS